MYLTKEEEEILEGAQGPFKQMCMEWLTEWGEAMHAKRMVPVQNVHALFSNQGNYIKGASPDIANFFFNELRTACKQKAKCHTTTDVLFTNEDYSTELNIDQTQVEFNQQLINEACGSGFLMVSTCAPYFVGNIPLRGEICAWAESSCIPFCNSVLGARTTRHSQSSTMAAAALGVVPEFGELLDENRFGDFLVIVNVDLKTTTDWGALGDWVGKIAGLRKPVFRIKNRPFVESLSQLGASLATTGAVSMYHVIGITPEAPDEKTAFGGEKPNEILQFGKEELIATYDEMTSETSEGDVCILGCPHANLKEIAFIANYGKGQKILRGKELWVCTPHQILAEADRLGYRQVIEDMGGKILMDTCPVVACWGEWTGKRIITDSFKQGRYALAVFQGGVTVRDTRKCIDSITMGRVNDDRGI